MNERNAGAYGGRGTRGIRQDTRPLQTARPLTREESREYTADVSERFYDDYRSRRNTGDAKNEVSTKLPTFDPELYKTNALRSLAYDPLRPVPTGLNFDDVLRKHTAVPGPRPLSSRQRTRRMSDPGIVPGSILEPQHNTIPAPRKQSGRPRSGLQKSMEETLNPTLMPAVEEWMGSASEKDRQIASKMFRTVSREGQRDSSQDNFPLQKKTSTGRVQSARQRSEEQVVKGMYQNLSKQPVANLKLLPQAGTSGKKLPRSKSETTTKGSMFAPSQRVQPSHFSIHPDWESEPRH